MPHSLSGEWSPEMGIDSLETVELVMALEDELGHTLPDEFVGESTTIGDIVDWFTRTHET
jgi:acyl carrier protein